MNIKNIFSTFLLVISIATVSNAQKCHYDVDKKDPFSGTNERRISETYNNYFTFAFYRSGDDFRLESYVNIPNDQAFIIPAGNKLTLKLTDGTTMELSSLNSATPQSYFVNLQIYSAYAMTYPITKEELKKIETIGIVFIRTYLKDESYYDMEIKKKKIEKLKNDARCIMAD
ncbi:MAG: hypothetical protein WCX31_05765 [Salinivirgaceae bacterium]|jgi:hypothetical protein